MGSGVRRCMRVLVLAACWFATCAIALPGPVIKDLAFGESDAKVEAIGKLELQIDPQAEETFARCRLD